VVPIFTVDLPLVARDCHRRAVSTLLPVVHRLGGLDRAACLHQGLTAACRHMWTRTGGITGTCTGLTAVRCRCTLHRRVLTIHLGPHRDQCCLIIMGRDFPHDLALQHTGMCPAVRGVLYHIPWRGRVFQVHHVADGRFHRWMPESACLKDLVDLPP